MCHLATFFKKPEGYKSIAMIVHAYDRGEPLPQDELRQLVEALRVFTPEGDTDRHLQEFGWLAKLRVRGHKNKGQHGPTAGESLEYAQPVFEVFLRERELIASGESAKLARARSTAEVAAARKMGKRTLHSRIAAYADLAATMVRSYDEFIAPSIPRL
jgi:hypothetical protein